MALFAFTDNIILAYAIFALAVLIMYVIALFHSAILALTPVDARNCRWSRIWPSYLAYFAISAVANFVFVPVWAEYHAYVVPSEAMANTLIPGDYMMSNNSAYDEYGPERGDVVVFIYPGDDETIYVKRCVAGPRDTVEIRDKVLFVNEVEVPLPNSAKHIDTLPDGSHNILSRRPGGLDSRDNWGPWAVPPGSYFMMGDNRDNSFDSRYWKAVHRNLIIGKAMKIHWSGDLGRVGRPVR
jgi:signal peptidase I